MCISVFNLVNGECMKEWSGKGIQSDELVELVLLGALVCILCIGYV